MKSSFTLNSDVYNLISEHDTDTVAIRQQLQKDYPKLGKDWEPVYQRCKQVVDDGFLLSIEQAHLQAKENLFIHKLINELEHAGFKCPDKVREAIGWVTGLVGENGMRRMRAIKDIVEYLDNEGIKTEATALWPSEYTVDED